MNLMAVLIIILLTAVPFFGQQTSLVPDPPARLGEWLSEGAGLPAFSYTGKLPFTAVQKNGAKLQAPDDPFFMLGNHRFHMFLHVSGVYQLVSGGRTWLRLNQADKLNYGENRSTVELLDETGQPREKFNLTGVDSLSANPALTERVFGTGFAVFRHKLGNKLVCERVISVKPSATPYDGASAFVLTVKFTNSSSEELRLKYDESVLARTVPMILQETSPERWPFRYVNHIVQDNQRRTIKVDVAAVTGDPLLFESPTAPAKYDGFPPSLFMKLLTANGATGRLVSEKNGAGRDYVTAQYKLNLKPGEEKQFNLIIGYAFDKKFVQIERLCAELAAGKPSPVMTDSGFRSSALFRLEWKSKLPNFSNESDAVLRREMTWNAYCLEVLANYNTYYHETQIPQGTHYAYAWGENSSARDQFQLGLPLCYFDPALARSNLRYMMKRTTPQGDIRLIENGYGVSTNEFFSPSDQQLYYFEMLAEYLRVTGDYSFLLRNVSYYPGEHSTAGNSIERIEICFKYLRDIIGTGTHGLIHMRYADWNDEAFYLFRNVSYADFWGAAESHLDSAMAAVVLENLAKQLDRAAATAPFAQLRTRIERLTKSMMLFQNAVQEAFLRELGDRSFSRRCRVRDEIVGEDALFLEPQAYALQMSEIGVPQKERIWGEIRDRLLKGEVMGARLGEKLVENPYGDPMFATGLFWWALNGPLILGVDTFDEKSAWRLLRKMTFENHARNFPGYWEGYWTASDALGSSLMPFEGTIPSPFPAYCGHAHAWPLYCYYRLREKQQATNQMN